MISWHARFIKFCKQNLIEFDVAVKRFFTDRKTSIMKEQDEVYHYMNPTKNIPHFQPLLNGKHLYFLQFRVVKIKVVEGGLR
jgi:hypothetical protein